MDTRTGHDIIVAEIGHKQYLPNHFDSLFKALVGSGWCVVSDGHVESPQGYFSITEIPSHKGELTEMKDALDYAYAWPEAGWYVTIEDNAGFIFVYPAKDRDRAFLVYTLLADAFAKWDNE